MVILAFGDSILYGCWDEACGGWVERMKKHLNDQALKDKDFWGVIYNLGICGDTTEDLVKRFKSETEMRLHEDEELYFIFAFGANDAAYDEHEKRFTVSPEDYRKLLQRTLHEARVFSSHIILLTIPPVNDVAVKNIEEGKARKNDYVDQYNAVLKNLAAEAKVHLIDVHAAFIEQDPLDLLCDDGLHPNAKGQSIIFDLVRTYFADKK